MESNADTIDSMEHIGTPNLATVSAADACDSMETDACHSTSTCFNDTNVDATVIEKDICEPNNENKAESLDIEGDRSSKTGDGSDSGVEVFGNNVLQRAQSSNSGGYASSCGLEGLGGQSCASSMISCCSDTYDMAASKTSSTLLEDLKLTRRGEGTSEGGSESSSITGSSSTRTRTVVVKRPCPSTNKKKVAVIEPSRSKSKSSESDSPATARSRSRTTPSKQISKAPSLATQDRARSRDKSGTTTPVLKLTAQKVCTTGTPRGRTKTAPNSLPNIIDLDKSVRAASTTRVRTPGTTPTGDGRWPSLGAKQPARNVRGGSLAPESAVKTRVATLELETKSSALDKYATLPRRKRETSQDSETPSAKERSNSVTREPTLAKAVAILRKQHSKENTPSKTLPPYPRKKPGAIKTRIFHEMSVQTALTGSDVDCAIAGDTKVLLAMVPVEKKNQIIQVDIRDKEMERLESKLKRLTEEQAKLLVALQSQNEQLSLTEQKLCEEREEKLLVQKELQQNTDRVLAILKSTKSDGQDQTDGDSLLLLESQLKVSGEFVVKQQEEIEKLHNICRKLQEARERSLVSQKKLEKKKQKTEVELEELHTFLQDENLLLQDSLREAETELKSQKEILSQKETELERQKEECHHLVRISEQRRHENLALQVRLASLENKSRELLLHQGAAVSGAAVALSGLGSRLDSLVDQLVASYDISEQDLEDVIYHNEVYHNSSSSTEGSPKRVTPPSPQRGRSFVSAVIAAIKNAASGVRSQATTKPIQKKISDGNDSDCTDMLDSETEPCLMMENVLEDVTMPDSHSHNMISSVNSNISQKIDSIAEKIDTVFNSSEPNELQELPHNINRRSIIDGDLNGGITATHESLHSLSQAILNRQQSEAEYSAAEEMSVNDSTCDMPSLSEYCPALTLVDQVIDVDNLVTKLLKVLRIIHLENESSIEELNNERNVLRNKLKNSTNFHVKSELEDASEQLSKKVAELTETRTELQKHRDNVEKLNSEVWHLSSRCNQAEALVKHRDEETLRALQQWRDTGLLPDEEALCKIVSAKGEIPLLKKKLTEKERELSEIRQTFSETRNVMTDSWSKAVAEAKRQYDAIDRALETLHTVQSVVLKSPQLTQLQRDLEETNFQSASNLSQSLTMNNDEMNSSDYNANGSPIKVESQNQASIINGRA